jgi:hypothetical protein
MKPWRSFEEGRAENRRGEIGEARVHPQKRSQAACGFKATVQKGRKHDEFENGCSLGSKNR